MPALSREKEVNIMESKENTIPELLMAEGLDCQGDGNIYQFVMKDPDLHIYAKRSTLSCAAIPAVVLPLIQKRHDNS